MTDDAFSCSIEGLELGVSLLSQPPARATVTTLPASLPAAGLGATAALERLAPVLLGGAAELGAGSALAHMDPPTPWLTWVTALWNAALNQNLLHPDTSPAARDIERRVIDWIAPEFGMQDGHMTSGSTLSNLTALWAARDAAGVSHVVASEHAHLSIAKAARILGLPLTRVAADAHGELQLDRFRGRLQDAALVVTAGTTSAGVVERAADATNAGWLHVDAAWAGPLRFSAQHRHRLDGIERADSVAVSAHKWLFQPKDAALILFRDGARANAAIASEGAYLAAPNIGVAGSRGAHAASLLATLLAWGRRGVAARIDHCMALAQALAEGIDAHASLALYRPPQTGVVLWRHRRAERTAALLDLLPAGSTSTARIDGTLWLRNVAANPNADVGKLLTAIDQSTRRLDGAQ